MAPFAAAPLYSFRVNIDCHGARLAQENVQVFSAKFAKKINQMNASELGKNIKTVRIQRGLTLKNLQDSTGVHYTQISKMERGGCKLLSKNLLIICNFLHMSATPGNQVVPSDELAQRVQALVRSWPQSEGVIRHFLEVVEMTLKGGHVS
ncbi:helix-turn-helix domain-containing protein [Pseudomonas sp. s4]|uniref:helix-turn-helix domain-containing protein n=1 Tax=Pseudomonas sp. s4 TaxID=353218 RepID=UPI00398D136A